MIADDADFVALAYNLLLNRDGEPAGLNHWTQELRSGLSREEVLRAFLSSAEFRGRMGEEDTFTQHSDVDLIIPLEGVQFRVPAADLSLVPHLLKERSWEPHLTAFFRGNLKPGHTFMDVGANLGYFTVLCSPLAGRVIAFEPVAMTHRYCAANIALNGRTNVELHAAGLWHEHTTAEIRTDPSSLMGSSIAQESGGAHVETIRCLSLDRMLKDGELALERLDIMKMDVEGAEVSALQGMREMVGRFRPMIVMELNRPALARFGKTVDDVWEFFAGLNYRLSAFEPWAAAAPKRTQSLNDLKAACPEDGVIDILAVG